MSIVRGVDVFHWNPRRKLVPGRIGRLLPRGSRANNFGDMLGPAIVERIAPATVAVQAPRMLAVGSILHFAEDGDVVWGSGINGKVPNEAFTADALDVRAVRGPLTAAYLKRRGIDAPNVFGDPGLLAPSLLSVTRSTSPSHDVLSLPNLHDEKAWASHAGFLSPRRDYALVISTIADSRRVVTSSLHGIVIADALGVPVSFVRPGTESLFKYEDYFEGTGRRLPVVHATHAAALRADPIEPLRWDATPLLDSFPRDLWGGRVESPFTGVRQDD